MKPRTKLILVSIVAIILGFAIATPILFSYPQTRLQIKVDLVYAYISVPQYNKNVTGLWMNSSDPIQQGIRIISFFMVLNVTNLSGTPAVLTDFMVIAGQNISWTNYTVAQSGGYETITGPNYGDAVIVFTLGHNINWFDVWYSNQSRFIAVAGSVGLGRMDVKARSILGSMLENGSFFKDPIYLFGSASGQPQSGGIPSTAYSLKHVQLQSCGTGFLYNTILSDNQRWFLDQNGIDVYIVNSSREGLELA